MEGGADAGQIDPVDGYANAPRRQSFGEGADRTDRQDAIHLGIGHRAKVRAMLNPMRRGRPPGGIVMALNKHEFTSLIAAREGHAPQRNRPIGRFLVHLIDAFGRPPGLG